jgi:twinkle protein
MSVTYEDLGIVIPRYMGGSKNCKTFCPQCHEGRKHKHDRSLSVDLETGRWNCWHCGWADYLENHNRDARDRVPPPRPAPKDVAPPPVVVAPSSPVLNGLAKSFMESRGLLDVAHHYKVWGDDRGIHVPYYVDGGVVNIKHRWFAGDNLKAGHSMEAGAELTLWNIDRAKDQPVVAVTEGEWDAMAIELTGLMPAVSVPNGGTKGTSRMEYIDAAADILASVGTFYICTDTDDVGGALEKELVRRLGVEKCKRVTWSSGKDANDVLVAGGVESLRRDIEAATDYPIEGVVRPASLRDALRSLYHEGMARGYSTGIPAVDQLFTIMPGYINLVTGMPGSGKSELIDQFAVNTALGMEWKWAIFSPEGDPREEHMSRIAEKLSGLPFFEGKSPRMSWDLADRAVDWMEEYLTFIDPEEPTIDAILEAARVEVLRRGINNLVIDPWNELTHDQKPHELISDYISRRTRDIRRWGERNRVAIWIVNHPHSMNIDPKTGQYPVVRHYDLNGGAMWGNKCGAILSVWRDRLESGKPVELHVIKTKTRRIGRTGIAYLSYDTITGRYSGGTHDYEIVG